MLCEAMKWNHLPVAGGLYDQHPGFIDRMYYIFAERSKVEKQKQKRQEAEKGLGRKPSVAGRRRR